MNPQDPPSRLKLVITLLNIAIGWHFLYEGLVKLIDPAWSAAGYLLNSNGFLSGFFQWIAGSDLLLTAVDFINIAGLVIIGLFIMLGLFTRYAASAGALLIGLYYLAQPPWSATEVSYASEGHYLLVDKNLVELIALIVIANLPKSWYYGLHRLFKTRLPEKSRIDVPDEINHDLDGYALSRRNLVKNLISLPFVGALAFAFVKNHGWESFEETQLNRKLDVTDARTGATVKVSDPVDLSKLEKPVSKGKIADLGFSRLICGGNLISGFAHSRDLIYVSSLLKTYFTEKKVLDTWWICEQCGITTIDMRTSPQEINYLHKYWKQGGKVDWLARTYPKERDYKTNIDMAVDNGASAALIMGNIGDRWARDGKFDLIAEVLDYIKSKGVPAGLAGHELFTIQGAEEHNVGADFYMKTLHSTDYWSWHPDKPKDALVIDNYGTDNYWSRKPDETIRYMQSIDKPWIAFKVLAAGALSPEQGFKYVFENGADFACVGMFDFQIVENANTFTAVLNNPEFSRKREWMA